MTLKRVGHRLNAEMCKMYFVMRREINLTITSDTFLYISSTGTDDEQLLLASYSLKLSRCWHVYN